MKRRLLITVLAMGPQLAAAAIARAQDDPTDENDYAAEGTVEAGGIVGFSWDPNRFTVDIGPTVGWFVSDGVELSVITRFGYENIEQEDGSRASTERGSAVLEPSYHFALQETLLAFVGLGVGAGYNFDHPDFELIPRAGMNIEVGRAGVLTPAVRAPILFGKNQGPGDEEFGVLGGVAFEIGITTSL